MKKLEKTIFSESYRNLIQAIVDVRHQKNISQILLAQRVGFPKTTIGRIEVCERRLDVKEYFEITKALGLSKKESFALLDRFFPF